MVDVNTAGIVNTAITALPAIIALVRQQHAAANPEDPPLTDEQVFAALNDAVAKTVAEDDRLAADIRGRNAPPLASSE
jgi:hypothetical protein